MADQKQVDMKRRSLLKGAGAAAVVSLLPACAAYSPERANMPKVLPQINPRLSEIKGAAINFNDKRARENIAIAVLPIIYERTILKDPNAFAILDKKAKELIKKSIPEGAEFTVIRHDNVTAVIVYNPKNATIKVAFDGSEELGDFGDNANFIPHPLSGGRKVHSGYYFETQRRKNVKPLNEQNPTMADAVKMQIEKYASLHDGDVTLNMTGFSKGGCVSLLIMDKFMDEKLPENIKLADWQTFGSPAFANEEWNAAFEAKCKNLDITGSRVVVSNDTIPAQMTGKGFLQPGYSQIKNVVYLMPNADSSSRLVWVNPDEKSAEFKDQLSKLTNQPYGHDPDWYARLLGASLNVAVAGVAPTTSYVSKFERPKQYADNVSRVTDTKATGTKGL